MFLTNVLCKKAKTKLVLVLMRSTGSNHQIRYIRERSSDKAETLHFDPLINMICVYKEEKKLKSIKHNLTITKDSLQDTYGIIPPELQQNKC